MDKMTILEETHFRITCCRKGIHEGWGSRPSLRNHLQCRVDQRLTELGPFTEEIEALPKDDELRADKTVVSLLQEFDDLIEAKREALTLLSIGPGESEKQVTVVDPAPVVSLRPCWRPECAIQVNDRIEGQRSADPEPEPEPEKPRNLAQRLFSSCFPKRTSQRKPQSYRP